MAKKTVETAVNINSKVFFQLTPEGYALLQKHRNEGEKFFRKFGFDASYILGWRKRFVVEGTEGPQQVYSMQMWEMMQIFGPGCLNGASLFVNSQISFRSEDLIPVKE